MGKRFLGKQFERCVVLDHAVLDHAAMAVARILAEADVGDDGQVRHLVLDGLDRMLHDPLVGVAFAADLVLVLGNAEEDDRGNAEVLHLFAVLHEVVDGLLIVPGHGADLFFHALAVGHEERIDEIVGRKLRLPHHAPDVLVGPQPSRPVKRLEHGIS